MSRGELREMKLGTLGEERVERREGKVNEREREREEEGEKMEGKSNNVGTCSYA